MTQPFVKGFDERSQLSQLRSVEVLVPATHDHLAQIAANAGVIVCCSECAADFVGFTGGVAILANLGGGLQLSGECGVMRRTNVEHVVDYMRRQILEMARGCPDKSIVLCVHTPCTAASLEELTLIEQIDHMVRGSERSSLGDWILLVHIGATETHDTPFYTLDVDAWHRWFREYEIEQLGVNDDPDDSQGTPTHLGTMPEEFPGSLCHGIGSDTASGLAQRFDTCGTENALRHDLARKLTLPRGGGSPHPSRGDRTWGDSDPDEIEKPDPRRRSYMLE